MPKCHHPRTLPLTVKVDTNNQSPDSRPMTDPKPIHPPIRSPKHHPLKTWLDMRRAFVNGEGTIPTIARRFNVPPSTVQTKAKHEHWSRIRSKRIQALTKELEADPVQPPAITPQPSQNNENSDVARIEAQLERLNNLLDVESDPRAIEKLTLAITRLYERRRIFLGQPLPGSQRPSRKPIRPSRTLAEPIEIAPSAFS